MARRFVLVNVPIDLRQDWPKALQKAGFDPSKPCAWLAEGLVRGTRRRAQDLLFEVVDAVSSRALASNVPAFDPERMRRQRADMRRCGPRALLGRN